MSYALAITLPGLPPLHNRQTRGHWRVGQASRKKWRFAARVQALAAGKPTIPLNRARISCTRHSSVEPDYDGLVTSFKPILDGLRDAGIIVDDKMSVIGVPEYKWCKAPSGAGCVTITVSEVE